LQLRRLPESSWLDREQLHRIEGIFVYFSFLLLLYVISEKISAEKGSNLLRQAALPLLIYYTVTIGMPLANGGYRQGVGFWEHSIFVLVIPLLLILPVAVFGWQWKRMNTGLEPEANG